MPVKKKRVLTGLGNRRRSPTPKSAKRVSKGHHGQHQDQYQNKTDDVKVLWQDIKETNEQPLNDDHHHHHHHRRSKHKSRHHRQTLQEYSINVGPKSAGFAEDQLPLRVVLPPSKYDGENAKEKVFKIARKMDSETTDNNGTETYSGINVEEFECGVSVEGSDKQEWSFTLYDFDGRGQVTKEDLAGLMKALYDAVGSSISLPQTGTKTLKLRLSVTPDQSKKSGSKHSKERDNAAKVGNKDSVVKQNNLTKAAKMAESETLRTHSKEVKNDLSAGSPRPVRRTSKAEHRHLRQMVEKNFEQYKKQQQLRRHNSEQCKVRPPHITPVTNPTRSINPEESQDRRNYYLDLAGVENFETSDLLNTSAPAAILNPNPESPKRHRRDHQHHSKPRSRWHSSRVEQVLADSHMHQPRSRSHEVTSNVEATVEASANGMTNDSVLSKDGVELQSPKVQTRTHPKGHKFRPVSLPGHIPESVSPHHHRRHKHREKNRSLAMQNVAEWIEREHTVNTEGDNDMVVIQKHEHHHIHEHHHHHHYHHYHET